MVTGWNRKCLALTLFVAFGLSAKAQAKQPVEQDPPSVPSVPQPAAPTPAGGTPASAPQMITIPAGTKLPLVLRNGVSSRTAKPGDSIYFETIYPVAQEERIVIPMGTFVRGELLDIKRPGKVKGRGEIRIRLLAMTFPNGHVVSLDATPSSLDNGGRERVDSEGRVMGDSSIGHDLAILGITTGGGAYVGLLSTLFTGSSPGRSTAIGGGVGLAAGIATVLLTRGPEAELPRGTTMDFTFNRPLTLDASRLPASDAGRTSVPPVSPAPPESARQNHKNQSPRRRLPIRILP
jgi:hypothetical protein